MDLKEFGNSINKILNERLSSPFYGSLIVSWLVINWKIIYLTLFVDSKEIEGNKINYIIENYSDTWYLIWYPLISTVLLVCVIPFVTYGAYSLSLFFNNLRQKRKIEVEKSQVLTVEKSLQIRAEIQNQKVAFNSLLEDKNNEIEILKIERDSIRDELYQKSEVENKEIIRDNSEIESGGKDTITIEKILKEKLEDGIFISLFKDIIFFIQNGYGVPIENGKYDDTITLLIAYSLIKDIGKDHNGRIYSFTEKGKKFLQYYSEVE